MPVSDKPIDYPVDDITIATILLSDPDISIAWVEAEDSDEVPAHNAHCTWHLTVRGYTREEIDDIVNYFTTRPDRDGVFTLRCANCGLNWVDEGPCDECGDFGIYRAPSFKLFDYKKRDIIQTMREAKEELAKKRGEGELYD